MTSPSVAVKDHTEATKGDKLVLRGLKFHGYHGVKPEERKLGQKFLIDVYAWMDLRAVGVSDHLSDTISYTAIYSIVREVVEGPAQNLLESVAEIIASRTLTKYPQVSAARVQVGKPHVASRTLTKYPQVSAARVQVGKPHVAVRGPVDYLGVEIIRYRTSHV